MPQHRRSPSGSTSRFVATAQSTTPAGREAPTLRRMPEQSRHRVTRSEASSRVARCPRFRTRRHDASDSEVAPIISYGTIIHRSSLLPDSISNLAVTLQERSQSMNRKPDLNIPRDVPPPHHAPEEQTISDDPATGGSIGVFSYRPQPLSTSERRRSANRRVVAMFPKCCTSPEPPYPVPTCRTNPNPPFPRGIEMDSHDACQPVSTAGNRRWFEKDMTNMTLAVVGPMCKSTSCIGECSSRGCQVGMSLSDQRVSGSEPRGDIGAL